jgi:cardiolipin synthase (CMP-forming)
MTTANKITIVRILLVPFFIVQVVYYLTEGHELHRWLAIVAFAVAAISDGVDGFVARHFNQRSELGAILDPLADKLLLVSSVVLLSFHNQRYLIPLPIWLTTIILSRDALLLLGMAVIHFVCHNVKVRPHLTGKIATVLQMVAVVWTLLKWDARWLPSWTIAAAVFTGVSGLIYVRDGMRQLSASPASNPDTSQSGVPKP